MRRAPAGAVVAAAALVGMAVPAAPASAQGPGLAGYSADSLAAATHIELDSPGLFPVGDPRVGEIFELDLPFSRVTVSSGPVVDALATPFYPGDTAAHLGSAVAEFGGPDLPNDPAVAEAQYPPAPGHGTSASLQGSPPPAGVFTVTGGDGESTAGPSAATATSEVGGFSIAAPAGPPLLSVGSSSTTERSGYGDLATSTAATTVNSIEIAGLVHIGGIAGQAAASSDGTRGSPRASLRIGSVTVGGQSAWIDQDGVHVAGRGAGSGAVGSATSALNRALAADGITVTAVAPRLWSGGGAASASAGGVLITITRTVPATGVPGVPALELPGAPPIPLGTPPVPARITVALGDASAAVDATTVALVPTGASLADQGPSAVGGFVLAGAAQRAGAGAGASPGSVVGAITGPGTEAAAGDAPAAARAGLPGSRPVPVGLIALAVLAALVLAAPLLGYARWQLLGGRRR